MNNPTFIHKYFRSLINSEDTTVDMTMGNGNDTFYLSKLSRKVYAFDIQEKAIRSTEARLTEKNLLSRAELHLDSHSNAEKYIKGEIRAGMFNLGWLPGSGDRSVTTKRETTLPAVRFAVSRLADDGILLIAVYPGHAEGEAEGREVEDFLASLDRHEFCVSQFRILNSPTSPYFIIVERKEGIS